MHAYQGYLPMMASDDGVVKMYNLTKKWRVDKLASWLVTGV